MDKTISLKEHFKVNGRLSFVITNKAFETICKLYMHSYQAFFTELSAEEYFLIDRKKRDDGTCNYTIHFKGYCIICAENRSQNTGAVEGLLITNVKPEDFNSQIVAMSNGHSIYLPEGSCVTLRIKSENLYEEYVNGTRYGDTTRSRLDYSGAFRVLKRIFDVLDSKANTASNGGEAEPEEFEISENFEKMLELAENYSNLESMLEESRVRADGGLSYTKIEAVDYERTDRMAYRFLVTELKKDSYVVGAQIEFEDLTENTVVAEILAHDQDEKGQIFLDVLFKGQVNTSSFANVGTIRLSFSNVIKSVQQKAIDMLRTNEAPAKYMDTVFGKNQPQGFNNYDLSSLEAFYADKDKKNFDYKNTFPPNESQVGAIVDGIKSKDVFLVMGPPGTGKTTVILEWVKYFVREKNMRVLVSSQNNKAVDNVIERIIEEEGIDVLRIGSEAKLQENVKECMYENKIAALRANIVNATNNNTAALDDVINAWKKRVSNFPTIYHAIALVNKAHSELSSAISYKLKYEPLIYGAFYKVIGKTQDKINLLYKKFNSKLSVEKKRDNAKNPLAKFWFTTLFDLYKPSIKKLAKKILNLKQEEAENIATYTEYRNNYITAYNTIATQEFPVWLNTKKHFTALVEGIFAEKIESTLGMFAFTEDPLKFNTPEQFEEFGKKVAAEIQRANTTKQVLAEWSENIAGEQTYSLEKIVLENVNLVGATCIGISSQKRFSDLNFDVTIIDEAGQIQIHNALVPMSLSNKLIMLGDHKQIPPSADESILQACKEHGVDSTLLKKSLFEDLYNKLPESNKKMLDTQFRMPAEIADIISEWFYSGKYKSPPFKRNLASELPDLSEKPFIVIDTSDSAERFETPVTVGAQTVRYNSLEAQIVVDIIKHLREINYDFSQIGVIAGLKAQVAHIKQELVKAGFDATEVNEMVATLDSFQGQERKIILYSFTRSSKKPPEANRIGFLTELRRINVAMSRCKKTMVMIGDMPFLANCQSTVDYHGDEAEKDQTEKNFSEFIAKMLADVEQKERGEILNYAEFKRRINNNTEEEE